MSVIVKFEGEHNGKNYIANLVIGQADIRASVEFSFLQSSQDIHITEDMSPSEVFLRKLFYPALVASAMTQVGKSELSYTQGEEKFELKFPLSYEQFTALPEKLAIAWQEATYRLNPQWDVAQQSAEKKV